jgi:hypothetical protein
MAKLKKAEKTEAPAEKVAEEKTEKAAKEPEFKYGVKDLAAALGIKETSVRVKLRNAEVPKAGKSYGWNSKKELEEVAKQLQAKTEKAEKAA